MSARPSLLRASVLLGSLLGAAAIAAQTAPYPNKPVRLIVGSAPAGSTDVIARTIGRKMSEAINQQVVVDNRAGASGAIAVQIVRDAPPDGYTLLVSSSTAQAINPHLVRKPSYDPIRDLLPIGMMALADQLLVVNPGFAAQSVADLLALGKAQPGKFHFGSGGIGSPAHLGMELLMLATGVKFVHVPYKGGGVVVTETIANQVQIAMTGVVATLPHVKTGRLRMIAVTGKKRNAAIPEVPTVAETVPGFEATNWWGLYGPAKLPPALRQRLNKELNSALASQEIRGIFDKQGVEIKATSPEEFAGFAVADFQRWKKVLSTLSISVD